MEDTNKALCPYCKNELVRGRKITGKFESICSNQYCLGYRMNIFERKLENIEKFIFKEDVSLQTSFSRKEIANKKEIFDYEKPKGIAHKSPDKGKNAFRKLPLPVTREVTTSKSPLSIRENPIPPKMESSQFSSWIERNKPSFGWEFEFGSNWLRWIGVSSILIAFFLLISWSSQFFKVSREITEVIVYMTMLTSGIILHIFSMYLDSRYRTKSPYILLISRSLSFLSLGIYFLCLFALRFHLGSPFYQDEGVFIILILILVTVIFLTGWKVDSNIIMIEGQSICLWTIWHISTQLKTNSGALIGFSVELILISTVITALVCYLIAYRRKSLSLATTTEFFPLLLIFLPNSSSLLGELSFLPQVNYTLILLSFSCFLCLFITITFHSDCEPIFWGAFHRRHLSITSLIPVFLSYYLLFSTRIPIIGFVILQVVFVSAFIVLSTKKSELGVSLVIPIYLQLLLLIPETTSRLLGYEIFSGSTLLTVLLLFQAVIVWVVIIFSEQDESNRIWNFISGKHLQGLAISSIILIGILFIQNYVNIALFFSLVLIFPLLGLTQKKRLFKVQDYPEYLFSLSDILTYLSMFFYIYILTNERSNIVITFLGFIYFPVILLLSQYRTNKIQQNNAFQKFYPLINVFYVGFIFSILIYGDVLKDAATDLLFLTTQLQVSIYEFQNLLTLILFLWIMAASLMTIHYYRKEIKIWIVKFSLMILFPVLFHLILADQMVSVSIAKIFLLLEYMYFIVCWSLIRENSDNESETLYEEYILIPAFALIQYSGVILLLREITSWNLFSGIALYLLLPLVAALILLIYNDISETFEGYFMISSFLVFIFLIISAKKPSINSQLDYWIIGVFFLINSSIFFFCRILEMDLRQIVTRVLPTIKTKIKIRREIHAETSLHKFLLFASLGFLSNTISFFSYPDDYQLILILIILDFMVILALIAIRNRFLLVNTLNIYCLILFLRLLFRTYLGFPNHLIFSFIGILIQIMIHGILLFEAKFDENLNIPFFKKKMTLRGGKSWFEGIYQITSILNPALFYFFSFLSINLVINEFKIPNIAAFDILVIISLILLPYTIFLSRLNVSRYICEGGLLINLFLAGLYSFSNVEAIYVIAAITAFHSILYGFWNNQQGWRITGLGIIGYTLLYGSINLIQISDDLIKIFGLGLLGVISLLIGVIYTKFSEKFQKPENQESTTH